MNSVKAPCSPTPPARSASAAPPLARLMTLLEGLAESGRPMTLSELTRLTGLPKTTCHRSLATLVKEQLVQFESHTRSYRIGLRFMTLAFRTWHNLDLRRAAQDDMRALSNATGENVHLAVPEGNEIVYVDRVESHEILRLHSAIGNRASMHCTALGKAVLAAMPAAASDRIITTLSFEPVARNTITDERAYRIELHRARELGFAVAWREHQSDVCGVAASIRDFRGDVAGALSVSAPCLRADRETLVEWGPRVADAAERVSRRLGWLE